MSLTTTAGTLLAPVLDLGNGTYTEELQASTESETAIVTVTVDGVTLEKHPHIAFTRDGWPTVVTTNPEWGFTSGGENVTIHGYGFSGGNRLEVNFGGVPVTTIFSATDTVIECVTPAHAAGAVDVEVVKYVIDEPRAGVLRGGYTYVDSLELPLKMTKGASRDEVHLTWSSGPSGPVRLERSGQRDFAADVAMTAGLRGPGTSETAPALPSVLFYRVER